MPRPPDWPAWVHQTGFCFWDAPNSWQEPSDLTAFLAGERPVVALSSGSMADKVGGAFDTMYRTGIEAIRRAGARTLLIGAPPGALPHPLPDDVYALAYAPFSQVYPRCAAVIHHGGMGTVAQSLRAGIPALVVPWGVDQFFTGAQLARVGAGRWLRRSSFTVPRATARSRRCSTTPPIASAPTPSPSRSPPKMAWPPSPICWRKCWDHS